VVVVAVVCPFARWGRISVERKEHKDGKRRRTTIIVSLLGGAARTKPRAGNPWGKRSDKRRKRVHMWPRTRRTRRKQSAKERGGACASTMLARPGDGARVRILGQRRTTGGGEQCRALTGRQLPAPSPGFLPKVARQLNGICLTFAMRLRGGHGGFQWSIIILGLHTSSLLFSPAQNSSETTTSTTTTPPRLPS
jgi:hypothetical protein